jgi:hypothetical protein
MMTYVFSHQKVVEFNRTQAFALLGKTDGITIFFETNIKIEVVLTAVQFPKSCCLCLKNEATSWAHSTVWVVKANKNGFIEAIEKTEAQI